MTPRGTTYLRGLRICEVRCVNRTHRGKKGRNDVGWTSPTAIRATLSGGNLTVKRTVKIFGRSVPVALFVLEIPTIAALAWGAFLILNATASATVSVAAAPRVALVSHPITTCTIFSGAGSAGTPVLVGSDLSCSFSNLDETSEARMKLGVQNDDASSIQVNVSIPADETCFTFALNPTQGPASKIVPAGTSENWELQIFGTGDGSSTGTITCAGTTLPPFVMDVAISVLP